jgi:MFS family permease
MVSCLSVLSAVIITPVLPKMQAQFQSAPEAELLVRLTLAAPLLAIAVVSPIVGYVLDRRRLRGLLSIALVVFAIAGVAPVVLPTLPGIVASRVIVGVAGAAILVTSTTLIADFSDTARRNRYLGLQVVAATVAACAFFSLGGFLGDIGWRIPFCVYPVSLLFVPLVRRAIPSRSVPAPPPIGHYARRTPPLPWRMLLPRWLLSLVGAVVFYTPIVQISYLLDSLGAGTGTIGLVSTLILLSTAVGAVAFLQVADTSPYTLMTVAMGLTSIGFVIVASSGDAAGFAGPLVEFGLLVAGIGCGLLLPTLLTWSVGMLRPGERGRGVGAWTSSLSLGQFVSPIALLIAADHIGLLATFAGLAALCVLLAGLTTVAGRRARSAIARPNPQVFRR